MESATPTLSKSGRPRPRPSCSSSTCLGGVCTCTTSTFGPTERADTTSHGTLGPRDFLPTRSDRLPHHSEAAPHANSFYSATRRHRKANPSAAIFASSLPLRPTNQLITEAPSVQNPFPPRTATSSSFSSTSSSTAAAATAAESGAFVKTQRIDAHRAPFAAPLPTAAYPSEDGTPPRILRSTAHTDYPDPATLYPSRPHSHGRARPSLILPSNDHPNPHAWTQSAPQPPRSASQVSYTGRTYDRAHPHADGFRRVDPAVALHAIALPPHQNYTGSPDPALRPATSLIHAHPLHDVMYSNSSVDVNTSMKMNASRSASNPLQPQTTAANFQSAYADTFQQRPYVPKRESAQRPDPARILPDPVHSDPRRFMSVHVKDYGNPVY